MSVEEQIKTDFDLILKGVDTELRVPGTGMPVTAQSSCTDFVRARDVCLWNARNPFDQTRTLTRREIRGNITRRARSDSYVSGCGAPAHGMAALPDARSRDQGHLLPGQLRLALRHVSLHISRRGLPRPLHFRLVPHRSDGPSSRESEGEISANARRRLCSGTLGSRHRPQLGQAEMRSRLPTGLLPE